MANRYWTGGSTGGATDWHIDENWSTTSGGTGDAAAPTSSDDVTFDAGGASDYNCTASAAATCKTITSTADYANNLTFSDTLTIAGAVAFDHTGTLTLGSTTTQSADGNFHIGSGVGATTVTSCVLDLQGTGNLDIDKASLTFAKIKGAASGKTTTHNGAQAIVAVKWELGAGEWVNSQSFTTACAAQSDLTFNASHTLSGASAIYLRAGGSITLDVPVINGSGFTGALYIDNGNAGNYTLTYSVQGAITVGGAFHAYKNSTGATTFTTNNYGITVAGTCYFGNNSATNDITYNLGSSTLDLNGNFETTSYNTGNSIIELDTSTWTMAKDCDLGTNTTIAGYDTCTKWEFDGTVNCSLTSAGEELPAIVIKKTGGGCNFTDSISCQSFVVDAANNQGMNFNGQTLTSAGNVTLAGTGTYNLGNGITMNGASSTFSMSSTISTVTGTSCVLTMNGTTGMTIDIDENNVKLKQLVLGASAIVTIDLAAAVGSFILDHSTDASLVFTNGGTLTVNGGTTSYLYIYRTTTGDAFTVTAGTPTITGTGNIVVTSVTAGNTTNVPISSITFTTIGAFVINNLNASGSTTVNITGDISITGIFTCSANAGGDLVVNTNNYNISCATAASKYFQLQSYGNGSELTFNAGSSVIDCAKYVKFTRLLAGGTQVINLGTSTWYIGGDFDSDAYTTINNSDTCTKWEFDGTLAVTFTSAGDQMPAIVVKKTGGGFTCSDSLSCQSFTVDAANNQAISWSGQTLTSAGNVTLAGSSTYNLGNGITMNGASSTFNINTSVSTVTGTSCVLTMNGTTGMTIDIDEASVTLKQLVLGASAVVTISGAQTFTLDSGTASSLTIGNNATLTINKATSIAVSGDCSVWSIGTGCTINGTAGITIYNRSFTATLPAITYTGSGSFTFTDLAAASIPVFTMSGNINLGDNQLTVYRTNNTNLTTFNTDNNNLTCGALRLGSNATGTLQINCGSAILDIGSINLTTFNTGTTTINLGTSTWYISGDCDIGTNTTIDDYDTCTKFEFDGTTACGLTSTGESLPPLVIKKTGGGFTFSDTPSMQSLTIDAANNQAVSWVGLVLTSVGSVNLGGSGTLNMGNGVTITGNGTFTIGASLGAITSSSCVLTLQGDDAIVLNKALTVSRLLTKTQDKTITWTASSSNKLTISSYTAADWGGAASHLVTWVSATPTTAYYIIAPASTAPSYLNVTDCDNSAGTEIDASDGTNVDGTRNINWKFSGVSWLLLAARNPLYNSMNTGLR